MKAKPAPAPPAVQEPIDAGLFNGDAMPPARWSGAPVDVLVRLTLPLLDAPSIETRLRALNVSLRGGKGVDHVWMRAAAGEARLVVRTAKITPQAAVKAVRAKLDAAELAGDGSWDVAAIGRGAHSIAAVSIDSDAGRQQATREILGPVTKQLAGLDHGVGVQACGALREQVTLAYEPNAMANLGITFKQARTLLRDVAKAKGSLQARLTQTTMKPDSGRGVVAADRIVVRSGGIGEPGACEAFVGNRAQNVSFLLGVRDTSESAINAVSMKAFPTLKKTVGASARLFHHHLAVSERFLLVAAPDRKPEPTEGLRKRLREIAGDPGIIDLVAMSGIDGLPRRLVPLAQQGRVWTVWMALDNPAAAEVPISSLHDAVKSGGWTVHGLPRGYDAALSWLLGAWGTTGVVAVSRDPQRLAAPVSEAARMADGNVSIGSRRTGPRRVSPPAWFSRLDRAKATASRVSGADIAAVLDRLGRPMPLGRDGDRVVYEGFAGGVLEQHFGKLPLQPGVSFGALQRVADGTPTLDRISRDGRPALWYLQSAISVRADALADDFARVARMRIAPRRGVALLFMRVGDAPIGSGKSTR